jgi:hypothetical protein
LSWNNTVTCSWCYERGHNKNGCQVRKTYIAENPDAYESRHDADRLRRARTRQCSYCKGTGHNRRKCGQLKNDKQSLQKEIVEGRAAIAATLEERGLAIGALVSYQRDYWNDTTYVGLVESISWEDADTREAVTLLVRTRSGEKQRRIFKVDSDQETTPEGLKVLSPVNRSCILAQYPDWWLVGVRYDESKYIPKGERRPYRFSENY